MLLEILDEEISCRFDADKEEEESTSFVDIDRKQRLRSMKEQLEVARELKQKAVARLLRRTDSRTDSSNNIKEQNMDGCAPIEGSRDEMQNLECASLTDDLLDDKRENVSLERRQEEDDGEDADEYDRFGDWRIDSMSLPFVTSSLTADSLDRDDHTEMMQKYNGVAVLEQWVKADDHSVDSMGLLFNHVTCNPADTVTWNDWVFWR